jgi:hypothetical protein
MLLFPIKNYAEFVEKFGEVKSADEKKNRRNKLVLSCWKNRKFIHYLREKHASEIPATAAQLLEYAKSIAKKEILERDYGVEDTYYIRLLDWSLISDKYELDELMGICEDGDGLKIRYINHDNNKVYKMGAGKLFTRCLTYTAGHILPPELITYASEAFTERWVAENAHEMYELHVGDDMSDFEDIYDGSRLDGCFHSCMVGQDYHSFYANCVNAKAAYIENVKSGLIAARCVIFTEVRDDETGEIVRLAERQYSTNTDLKLQRILISKLIAAKEIDGYKIIGAGCHDNRAFISNTGDDWSKREFSIYCSADPYDDIVSYQDSFIGYSNRKQRAYNYQSSDYDLATTDGYLVTEYDDFHDYSCRSTTPCYYRGNLYNVDDNNLDEFVWINDEYHHQDDVTECENCGELILKEDAYYDRKTDEYYCDENCYLAEHGVKDYFTGELINPDSNDTCKIVDLDGNEHYTTDDGTLDHDDRYTCEYDNGKYVYYEMDPEEVEEEVEA